MSKLVQVQIGEYRPVGVYDSGAFEVKRGDMVIVDQDRSLEFGRIVASTVPSGPDARNFSVQGKITRKVSETDERQIENNRFKARESLNGCISKVNDLALSMKVLMAEYSFDASKVLFYFTAEGRIDFRDLVKELAKVLRVRIELKQIGVRDRAKLIKGYGVCGQPLCCSTFIKDFSQLSIKMAKEQALPLNPTKISGVCGRIKCCMAYEYNVYKELNKGLPKIGAKVQTADGRGRVINLDILKRVVQIDMGEGKIVRVQVPVDGDSKDIFQQVGQADAQSAHRGNEGRPASSAGTSSPAVERKTISAPAAAGDKKEARSERNNRDNRPRRDNRGGRRPDARDNRGSGKDDNKGRG